MNWTACVRAWIFVVLLLPMPLLAQEESANDSTDSGLDNEWFPGEFAVAPLLAFSLEIRPSAALLWVERDIDDNIDGWNLEARVGIGFRLPMV